MDKRTDKASNLGRELSLSWVNIVLPLIAQSQSSLVFSEIDTADINKLYRHHIAQEQTDVPQTKVSTKNIITQVDASGREYHNVSGREYTC